MNMGKSGVLFGVAGALIGIEAYRRMTPTVQHQVQRSIKKTVNELKDIADDINQNIRNIV